MAYSSYATPPPRISSRPNRLGPKGDFHSGLLVSGPPSLVATASPPGILGNVRKCSGAIRPITTISVGHYRPKQWLSAYADAMANLWDGRVTLVEKTVITLDEMADRFVQFAASTAVVTYLSLRGPVVWWDLLPVKSCWLAKSVRTGVRMEVSWPDAGGRACDRFWPTYTHVRTMQTISRTLSCSPANSVNFASGILPSLSVGKVPAV